MSVPISSFASHQVLTSRLTPVGRTPAAGSRTHGSDRDAAEAGSVIHLSEGARAILAGTLPPSEVTVVPAREAADDPTADDVRDAEFEEVFHRDARGADNEASATGLGKPRTPEQERAIQQLRTRDTEVRAHEAAHAGAAGSLGGRPSLEYVIGPDGQRYAVAGEVSIDTSSGRTPEETIAKARTIRAAATAPASPSAQDMAVAAAATHMESEAQDAIRERHQFESHARLERVSAESIEPDSVRRIEWSKVGASKGPGTGAANDVDVNDVKEPVAVAARPAGPAESAALDPEMVMLQLVREQVSARGGMGHSHLSSGCGFCRRAAATYA